MAVAPLRRGGLEGFLERLREVLEEVRGGAYCCYRHGLPYVRVGDLVEQVFCEYRVELRLRRGEEAGARRRELRFLLEALAGARRRAERLCHSRGAGGFLSAPLAGLVGGVALVGRPDLLVVGSDCVVEGVVWARVGGRLPRGIGVADRVRLYAYAALVDYVYGGGSGVYGYLVWASSRDHLREALDYVSSGSTGAGEGFAVYRVVYDEGVAMEYLGPLLAYWKGAREPRPNTRLCARCSLRGACPYGGGLAVG